MKLKWTMPKSHHRRELKWRQVSRILYTNLSSLRTSFPFGGYRKKYTREWHARTACSRELEPIEHYNPECEDLVGAYDICTISSLRSKRFQSSHCAKVRAGEKKKGHSFFFFCSRPDVLDELARKRLLRRLTRDKFLSADQRSPNWANKVRIKVTRG